MECLREKGLLRMKNGSRDQLNRRQLKKNMTNEVRFETGVWNCYIVLTVHSKEHGTKSWCMNKLFRSNQSITVVALGSPTKITRN